jgi:hypothetical protein
MPAIRRLLGLAPALLILWGCQQTEPEVIENAPAESAESIIERGEYLVTVGGCNDCHTPKIITETGAEPDMSRLLSGHPADDVLAPVPEGIIGPDGYLTVVNQHLTAWVGPWGVSFAMNLTPDRNTGLGSWTEEMFVNALRTGKHEGGTGRDILLPMPWFWYRYMTDEDLSAMYAYLQSLPPIENPVPEPLAPEEIPR